MSPCLKKYQACNFVFCATKQWLMQFPARQGALVSFIGRIRANTARFTDERVRLAGEAIAGSLAVKMLGARLSRFLTTSENCRALSEKHLRKNQTTRGRRF